MGSGIPGSLSWPSSVPFEVSVYLRNYAWSSNAERFQAILARGVSRIIYDARHEVGGDTRVNA